jgi:hypothetical protein
MPTSGRKGRFAEFPTRAAERPDRAHGARSDERHRFSEAVIHGRGAKWLGWVDSGPSRKVLESVGDHPVKCQHGRLWNMTDIGHRLGQREAA